MLHVVSWCWISIAFNYSSALCRGEILFILLFCKRSRTLGFLYTLATNQSFITKMYRMAPALRKENLSKRHHWRVNAKQLIFLLDIFFFFLNNKIGSGKAERPPFPYPLCRATELDKTFLRFCSWWCQFTGTPPALVWHAKPCPLSGGSALGPGLGSCPAQHLQCKVILDASPSISDSSRKAFQEEWGEKDIFVYMQSVTEYVFLFFILLTSSWPIPTSKSRGEGTPDIIWMLTKVPLCN